MTKPLRHGRCHYRHATVITTRWMDNDMYGHANNVVYYSFLDTVVNAWLIERGLLDPNASEVIGLVVESGCRYFEPLGFPEPVDAGLAVGHLGRSSVRYEVGLFRPGAELAAAQAHFVHVYVDRASRRPIELPAAMREGLQTLLAPPPQPLG